MDISFNKEKLAELASNFSTFNREFMNAKGTVLNEIKKIETNWQGEEFEKANEELRKIVSSLDNIEVNSNNINQELATTAAAFERVNYNL